MSLHPLVFLVSLAFGIGNFTLLGQKDGKHLRIGEQPLVAKEEPKGEPVSIDSAKLRRTSVFDATEIRKLYKEAKTQNDKLNEGLPAHLNAEELDLVTLKTLDVGGGTSSYSEILSSVWTPNRVEGCSVLRSSIRKLLTT